MTRVILSAAPARRRRLPEPHAGAAPPWAARALCEFLERVAGPLAGQTAWEPGWGAGGLAGTLSESFGAVVHAHGGGWAVSGRGFRLPAKAATGLACDWIVADPPEARALACARAAVGCARAGVAILARAAFLEGGPRFAGLFAPHPPAVILTFAEPLPWDGGEPAPGCWIVWSADLGRLGTWFRWIPPCRARLERPGEDDAPAASVAAAVDSLRIDPGSAAPPGAARGRGR